jgi:hypothetical protein
VVSSGVWHGRDLRDSFWPRKGKRSCPELWTHSDTPVAVLCGPCDPPPPQRDVQMLWVLQEKSSALVCTQWPLRVPGLRWGSPSLSLKDMGLDIGPEEVLVCGGRRGTRAPELIDTECGRQGTVL